MHFFEVSESWDLVQRREVSVVAGVSMKIF